MDTQDMSRSGSGSASKRHSKNVSHSSRTPLARRSTKGPLDVDNPLAPDASNFPSVPTQEAAAIPIPPTPSTAQPTGLSAQDILPERPRSRSPAPRRDLSFLLQPENFHPIPQTTIPQPFLSSPPPSDTPLSALLHQGHYLPAATLAATTLTSTTSSLLPPAQIFSLLYARLACLAITSHDEIAAQESLILGDIHSPFYSNPEAKTGKESNILPWHLRLLATRLQALGAKDPKRAVQGYYDLAGHARGQYRLSMDPDSRELWRERLRDLGLRTGNALVEMGDVGGARRFLGSLADSTAEGRDGVDKGVWVAMLCLRMGDVEGARRWIEHGVAEREEGVLDALLMTVEGRNEDAVAAWRGLLDGKHDVLARHALAVCLIYTGELAKAEKILEDMVDAGHAFHALTFNLATMYELRSDKARERKMLLAERVAGSLRGSEEQDGRSVERRLGDFKM